MYEEEHVVSIAIKRWRTFCSVKVILSAAPRATGAHTKGSSNQSSWEAPATSEPKETTSAKSEPAEDITKAEEPGKAEASAKSSRPEKTRRKFKGADPGKERKARKEERRDHPGHKEAVTGMSRTSAQGERQRAGLPIKVKGDRRRERADTNLHPNRATSSTHRLGALKISQRAGSSTPEKMLWRAFSTKLGGKLRGHKGVRRTLVHYTPILKLRIILLQKKGATRRKRMAPKSFTQSTRALWQGISRRGVLGHWWMMPFQCLKEVADRGTWQEVEKFSTPCLRACYTRWSNKRIFWSKTPRAQ